MEYLTELKREERAEELGKADIYKEFDKMRKAKAKERKEKKEEPRRKKRRAEESTVEVIDDVEMIDEIKVRNKRLRRRVDH